MHIYLKPNVRFVHFILCIESWNLNALLKRLASKDTKEFTASDYVTSIQGYTERVAKPKRGHSTQHFEQF